MIDINDAAVELFGYLSRDELMQICIPDLYVKKEERTKIINTIMEKGYIKDYPVDMRRKDGGIINTLMTVSLRCNVAGKAVEFMGTIKDITELKMSKEALRQSEEKYRKILESMEEGYFEVDFAGNFTFFNDSLRRYFDYSGEELMGMNYRQYTEKEHSKVLFQTFNKFYSTGELTEGFDWQIIKKDRNEKIR